LTDVFILSKVDAPDKETTHFAYEVRYDTGEYDTFDLPKGHTPAVLFQTLVARQPVFLDKVIIPG